MAPPLEVTTKLTASIAIAATEEGEVVVTAATTATEEEEVVVTAATTATEEEEVVVTTAMTKEPTRGRERMTPRRTTTKHLPVGEAKETQPVLEPGATQETRTVAGVTEEADITPYF